MRKEIFRSVTVFALSAAVAMSSCIGSAAQGLVKIYYDGNVITPEPEPVIVNDRTMVSAEDFLSKTKIGFDKKEDGALTVKSGEKSVEIAENQAVEGSDAIPFLSDGTLFMPLRAVFEALNKKVDWVNAERTVMISSADDAQPISAVPQKVKDGKKAAIVFIHDDGGKATGRWLVKVLPKYNINGSVAIIGKSIDPEYNVDEPDNFEKWQVILGDAKGRLNFAVHSHGHRYLGETDEAESGVLSDGKEYNYDKGHLTKDIADERARINAMFPDERLLTFVKPGTLYPEGKKQVSDAAMDMIKEHYIAMRNTGGEVDTLPPEDIYSVKSLMGRSSNDYSNAESNQTAQYWIAAMDEAVEKNGMLVYLFHNIGDEASAVNNSTAKSRVEMLLAAIEDRMESGDVWNGKFDEVMQYTQEFNAITGVEAFSYPSQNYMTVKVSDSISKIDTDLVGTKFEGLDMFDYPITVKVELPYDWKYAKLTQEYGDRIEIVKPFTEDGVRYIYANVVPDKEAAAICEATEADYISGISVGGSLIEGFEPTKFYYKVALPVGTTEAPQISAADPEAEIIDAQLDENGEGSAFVKLGQLKYEVFFFTETDGKDILLRIDPSNDDINLTATKKVTEYLASKGITANITDAKTAKTLKNEYENAAYCEEEGEDTCEFDFDDGYTEDKGDFMPDYNKFVQSFRTAEGDSIVMTMHPQDKGDIAFSVLKDQIEFLTMQGARFK